MKKYEFTKEQRSALESIRVPFAVYQYVDKQVLSLVISDGFCDLFGYENRETAYYDMDHDMYREVHPDDAARIEEAAVRFATEDGKYDVIYRSKKKGGSDYIIVHSFGEHIMTDDGVRLAHVWYSNEGKYSEEIGNNLKLNAALNNALHEESIMKANRYDFLTGLPSMTYFFEIAGTKKKAMIADGENPALLFMDICGLKYFNHKYGFAEGDKLLQSFSKTLSRFFGNENCCHVGQDHFAVFTSKTGLEEKLERFFNDIKELNDGESMPVRVGIYFDENSNSVPVSSACDMAKLACDSLRGTYESAFCYYRNEFKDEVIKKQYILENFNKALNEQWISVYYQPIIRAANGRVCDEEALSRWVDPVNGILSPADFIPALEDSGLIYKLDLYVLDKVIEKIKIQQTKGLTIVPHSINLSRSDFDACDIVKEICNRIDASGVGRDKITIEITESVIGSDFDFMKEQISRFRSLGFAVWMDDFGSGYSSLDVLQSIKFDLIKFDMSFMKKFNEGYNSKVILTELMKLATSIGVDTVCEGVENEEQVHFLQEIGCSKLQGYYYCKPISFEALLQRYENGMQVGYENPDESEYYDVVGRVNLYDLTMLASDGKKEFENLFDTIPMGVIEVKDDTTRFMRSNQSYRDFIKKFLGFDLSREGTSFTKYDDSFMNNVVKTCCERGQKSFYDESMPDGTVVHSFARRIGINPVNGNIAVAVAVLSITDVDEGTTYANIARALASDYYNIYYVDLETERFIEYTSPIGGEELAMERHGENFFEACQEAADRIYFEDRGPFFESFTKENIIHELDVQGVFTTSYRLVDTGTPMYVNMKVTRMHSNKNHIIMGISIIDAQMKHGEHLL